MNLTKQITFLIIYIFSFQFIFPQTTVQQEFEPEPFTIMLDFYQVGGKSFTAMYDQNSGNLLLPVKEIFDFLKINNKFDENRNKISGFIENEKNNYTLNIEERNIYYRNRTYTLNQHDLFIDMGILYLSSLSLQNIFNFSIQFEFRSLSAKVSANFDFPVVKQLRLENARANLRRISGEIAYDDTIGRESHVFRFGMIDWSLNSMQGITKENRAGLGIGMELLGGELSSWLNYSDVYGFNRNIQRYYWRWVNNEAKFAKQIQVGRVYNSSVSTLLHPVDGITITNTPSTIRKSLGQYLITDYTEPDWLVELYINNILVDYTTANASGLYTFNVPVTYGTTNITLRFYGPNGEERMEEKRFNMPYNFLPKGEFEYRITGGYVLDKNNSLYGRAESSLGITKGLTMGGGIEYFQGIVGNSKYIPFVSTSAQPLPQLIFIAEYAHNVRTKASLNYTFPKQSVLELNYAHYQKDQTAIIFNYQEERYGRVSVPFLTKKVSGFLKGSFRQLIYPNFSYNSCENTISGYHGRLNVNVGNFISWTSISSPNIYTTLALGYRMPRNMNIRLSSQYNHTTNNLIFYKGEVEKQIANKGLLTLGYENNILTNFQGINISFRYDLSFMTAFASASIINKQIMSTQNLRGSLAFGSGNRYVHTDKNMAVGRSGISIIPFVDINHNGMQDDDEPLAEKLNVRCNGGQTIYREKDNILRINGLEPFIAYSLIIDELGFDQLSWQVKNKNVKVTTDPNQFKRIYVPVTPMGEVYGNVVDESGNGMGRVLVNIFSENDSLVTTIQSESDGYFSYLGLIPGKYMLKVDTLQLRLLEMTADEKEIFINPCVEGDIIDAGNIVLYKIQRIDPDSSNLAEMNTHKQYKVKQTIDSPVLFDFDKSDIRKDNYEFLQSLVSMLENNPCMTIRIEAHTCSMGSESYNQALSERRANSVRTFMIEKGIQSNRLDIIGFGEKRPLNNNLDRFEKARNRRATFVITTDEDCLPVIEQTTEHDSISSEKTNKNTGYIDKNKVERINKETISDFNILFDFDKHDLSPENKAYLSMLLSYLKHNTDISLEIGGHTDSDGTTSYNQKLSERRAMFIKTYLVKQGINENRLIVVGYGETRPLNDNKNSYEKALNRRVTFKITSE